MRKFDSSHFLEAAQRHRAVVELESQRLSISALGHLLPSRGSLVHASRGPGGCRQFYTWCERCHEPVILRLTEDDRFTFHGAAYTDVCRRIPAATFVGDRDNMPIRDYRRHYMPRFSF